MLAPVNETWAQAERLRISGCFESAARVYRELLAAINASNRLWVPARHMLAVTLKSLAAPGTAEITEAEKILFDLVTSGIVTDEVMINKIERDHADVFRKIGIYPRARELAQQTFEAFMNWGRSDEAGISLGFVARAEFDYGQLHTAVFTGEMADRLIREFTDAKEPWLYNMVWVARYYAHTGSHKLPLTLMDIADALKDGLGNGTHRRAIEVIRELHSDPIKMEEALASAGTPF
ncbi:MAG TPA: hypothetical protein VLF21_02595 [Candidatus Saccharimonadales bacterium]|nr:hypothetical protein [Candidatus Saccharimonadales bacterium]